ncbi:outer membrane porin, OprD family [Azotobacter beijerinckii]|uniref:Outer membrane porin, OprD family n=1 Tax=Azotobacter beijerinckii TaxID=170623 RepID=A0A1I4F7A6_9GAMM|nr:OprD family porin [Azotobacter beijerinckii]SEJ12812.1 outer membrane porin, OprD family [Azotobacter beijerinckii]SEJ39684.1 outer membrane porin, OprD family [Azotobacter beijerinckii]SER48803.1 outer membrane porin, OprD family [Azotobacter beijerinckii]SFB57192.1 outer membrane porin, OprD family [Azotobacter beijerinckii]SFL13858.1 outer membrane porin, OprD family [Azotobacter beijerinckii]
MNKSYLALAVVLGGAAQQAGAAGFFEDSKATLGLRNLYFNQDNRDGTAAPSMQKEWGQGFLLDYKSGYTPGPVGVGVDALGMWGVRLDSGKGTHYNPNSTNYSGQLFPTNGDGRAVHQYGSLGPTLKVRVSKTEARVGTFLPKLPVVTYNDGRLLPQTFEGAQLTTNEIDNLTLTGGKFEHAKGRSSTNSDSLSIAGANNAQTGQFSNRFYFAGADYKLGKNLLLQYYYGTLDDFYEQHFVGLQHDWKLPVGLLKTDLRYFNSDSDGKNASASGRAEGYRSSGYWAAGDSHRGEVDNRLWSAKFTYLLEAHELSVGVQRLSGNSDFPVLNQGDGYTSYLITDSQIGKFLRAGERTWRASYAYDFAKLGVPGLKASAIYLHGDNIDTNGSDTSEWERDLRLDYVVQGGLFKGVGFSYRNATLRSEVASQRNIDENRLYITYSVPLL